MNGQAEYSEINVMTHNEWINKIFDCVIHNSGTCKLEEGVDIVNFTQSSIVTTIYSTYPDMIMNVENTTTTTNPPTHPTSSFLTTYPSHFTILPPITESNSEKTKPIILLVVLFTFGIIMSFI